MKYLTFIVSVVCTLFLPIKSNGADDVLIFKPGTARYPLVPLEGTIWDNKEMYGITGKVTKCGTYMYVRTFEVNGKIIRHSGFLINQEKIGRVAAIDRQIGLRISWVATGTTPEAFDFNVPDNTSERHGGFFVSLPPTEYENFIRCTNARKVPAIQI